MMARIEVSARVERRCVAAPAPRPSFRDGPKDQTRNLEIPGSHFVRPGMTESWEGLVAYYVYILAS